MNLVLSVKNIQYYYYTGMFMNQKPKSIILFFNEFRILISLYFFTNIYIKKINNDL